MAQIAQSQLYGVNEAVALGPLRVSVVEAMVGPTASELVLEAGTRNLAPRDGLTHAAARVEIENAGTRAVIVDHDDFGFATSAGRVRQSLGIWMPAPELSATIEPGASVEGWVAGIVEDGDPTALMIFNCRDLGGDWAEGLFSLMDGSTVPFASEPAVGPNEEGEAPESPASVGVVVATEEWVVAITEVALREAVFDLYPPSDYRTTALGSAVPDLIQYWVGLRVELQNNSTGDRPSHFPVSAFSLAYSDGAPVPGVRVLSSPLPDLQGLYFPGASASGWITFEVPIDYSGSLVRFHSYRVSGSPRFLTWADGSAPANSATPLEEDDTQPYEAGAIVNVIEDSVNLRDSPSINGTVVTMLARDTTLTVMGGPEEADGYVWYQVVTEDGESEGFVVSQFLRRA